MRILHHESDIRVAGSSETRPAARRSHREGSVVQVAPSGKEWWWATVGKAGKGEPDRMPLLSEMTASAYSSQRLSKEGQ